ncbi:hypothetical protein ALCH109712_08255 [Alkalicoccus chagannorensis]
MLDDQRPLLQKQQGAFFSWLEWISFHYRSSRRMPALVATTLSDYTKIKGEDT